MPRNSSGVYSQPAGTAAVSGATASSSAFNDLIDDIGDEITGSLPVDGSKGMSAPLESVAGTVSLPGVTFAGDPNTGFYHIGADSVGLTLGGTLRITYATSGITYAVPINFPAKATVASATTTDIGAAASNTVSISGTTTITGLGTAAAGVERWVTFEGVLTLTHNGTSLILPGAANILTGAGDVAHFKSEGSGNWRCYAYHRAAVSPFSAAFPTGHLFGLTLSNNGTDATNDLDIATGSARDSTDAVNLVLGSAITKRLDSGWAVGTGNGGLDTGSIADTTYHVWLIKRSDTGVVDALFSTSASSPTMPTNYDYKRRIGSIIRESSAIVAFTQDGDHFTRVTAIQAASSATNPGTSAVTAAVEVPAGIRVRAKLGFNVFNGSSGNNTYGRITDLDEADLTPDANNTMTSDAVTLAGGVTHASSYREVRTNTSRQVRVRISFSSASVGFQIYVNGWIDTRGRVA